MSRNGRPQAGDPFSRAYSQQGNPAAARRTGQPAPGMGAVQSPSPHDPFKGYGFDNPMPNCAPSPQDALLSCIRAFQETIASTFQLADLAPWIHPTYRAVFNCEHVQFVIGPSSALDAAGNAAAVALAAAASGPGFTVNVLQMETAASFVDLFTLTPQQGNMIRIKSWGISPGNAGAKNLATKLLAATVGGTPAPPNPFISGADVANHQDAFVLLNSTQTLKVQAQIRDLSSPTLVDFGICYWIWPINKRSDSKEGTLLRSGYKVDC